MEYNVKFVHPTTGAVLEANINPELSASDVIAALVSENFITPEDANMHYSLAVNGGEKIEGAATLSSGGLRDGGTVRIIPNGSAG